MSPGALGHIGTAEKRQNKPGGATEVRRGRVLEVK